MYIYLCIYVCIYISIYIYMYIHGCTYIAQDKKKLLVRGHFDGTEVQWQQTKIARGVYLALKVS